MCTTHSSDTDHALSILRVVRSKLGSTNDIRRLQYLNHLIAVIESPLFNQLLSINQSLDKLAALQAVGLDKDDFSLEPRSGELEISDDLNARWRTANDSQHSPKLESSPTLKPASPPASRHPLSPEEFEQRVIRLANGQPIVRVQLVKGPGQSSLGFSVVGLKGKSKDNTGVFIHDVLPGSVAVAGGVQEGDQVLAIDGVPLDDLTRCHSEAIALLQVAHSRVDLVLARSRVSAAPAPASHSAHTPPKTSTDSAAATGRASPETAEVVPPPLPVVKTEVLTREGSIEDMLNTEWTEYEVIDLINDGSGFGFGIIGGRTTGVVVRTVLAGGVADRDGRLRPRDHIMYIGSVCVRQLTSDQVAHVLRAAGDHVRLIVARPFDQNTAVAADHQVQIVETSQLDAQLELIVHRMYVESPTSEDHQLHPTDAGQPAILYLDTGEPVNMGKAAPLPHGLSEDQHGMNDAECLEAVLIRETTGLGITIAGYVSDTPEAHLRGIFIKSVTPGSVADRDGKIKVNDKIIEVNGISLETYDNRAAVEILRNSSDRVQLRLLRYKSGPIFRQLLHTTARQDATPTSSLFALPEVSPTHTEDVANHSCSTSTSDVDAHPDAIYSGPLTPAIRRELTDRWQTVLGSDVEIIVAQFSKSGPGGGLGISLEGTVDVDENGLDVHPHHYIRAVVEGGPAGRDATLQSADELLEVNGRNLYGLNHLDVVNILKQLPRNVRIVCARYPSEDDDDDDIISGSAVRMPGGQLLLVQEREEEAPRGQRLADQFDQVLVDEGAKLYPHKSKSEERLLDIAVEVPKSRSADQMDGLAVWGTDLVYVDLDKGDHGLGFSILDYQDPVNSQLSVVVIRSLVPGGAADRDGRILPGDRLMLVNEKSVEHATLEEAVAVLKGTPRGPVRLAIAKAFPLEQSRYLDLTTVVDEELKRLVATGVVFDLDEDGSPGRHIGSTATHNEGSSDCDADEEKRAGQPRTDHLQLTPGGLKQASNGEQVTGTAPVDTTGFPARSDEDTIPPIPVALEQKIRIRKEQGESLGIELDVDHNPDQNGAVIGLVQRNSPAGMNGQLAIGDYLTAVEGESLRDSSMSQAKLILRRMAVLSGEVSVSYIPGGDAQVYLQSVLMAAQESCQDSARQSNLIGPNVAAMVRKVELPSRSLLFTRDAPKLSPQNASQSRPLRPVASIPTVVTKPNVKPTPPPVAPKPAKTAPPPTAPKPSRSAVVQRKSPIDVITPITSTKTFCPPPERENSIWSEDSLSDQSWGEPRPVVIARGSGESLGISIVGGRAAADHLGPSGHTISGIFIKEVKEGSPAARVGSLRPGDRILEVNGESLRHKSHEEAVECIRAATSPVHLCVQSIAQASCPSDLEDDPQPLSPNPEEEELVVEQESYSGPHNFGMVKSASTSGSFPLRVD